MKQCWLDIRASGELAAPLCIEAVQHGFDAVVAEHPADLAALPRAIARVLIPAGGGVPAETGDADLVLVDPARQRDLPELARRHPDVRFGCYVEVTGARSLAVACASARESPVTLLRFRDPTYIPLEIVLAAAAGAPGTVITVAGSPADAAVQLGVLERGPDGVMLAPRSLGEAGRLRALTRMATASLPLATFEVTAVTHAGMGERACVDTCSYLSPEEGILVGSRSRALVLCASETHPLPYMPTRPFRVNAGAVMSYTLADPDRTRYLSELTAGGTVLVVDVRGQARSATIGRVKIETRPLLSIDAVTDGGEPVNLIVQDDWHVRVLGPDGAVLNSTALRPGDRILGYLPGRDRHVGYPIDERCHEQ